MKALLLAAALVAGLTPTVARAGGLEPPDTSPVHTTGARTVETRNASGGLTRQASIPGNSSFASYGGARTSTCQFTAATGGATANGTPYVAGQVVISTKWVFREVPSSFSPEPQIADNIIRDDNKGPLASAFRYFAVYCDSKYHLVRASIPVTVNDPMLNPRPAATDLYNRLQLERPEVYTNPVVDIWGGLVTRYPVWLAIEPGAWRPQKSSPAVFLGWTLLLLTEPKALEFEVSFVPNPDKPSPAFSGVVPCVTDPSTVTADTVAFPSVPMLPEQTEPGTNGQCMWTPPGPGTVTIQARITYSVTFWANGYTEPLADYIWTSPATTYRSGELSAVNTNN